MKTTRWVACSWFQVTQVPKRNNRLRVFVLVSSVLNFSFLDEGTAAIYKVIREYALVASFVCSIFVFHLTNPRSKTTLSDIISWRKYYSLAFVSWETFQSDTQAYAQYQFPFIEKGDFNVLTKLKHFLTICRLPNNSLHKWHRVFFRQRSLDHSEPPAKRLPV